MSQRSFLFFLSLLTGLVAGKSAFAASAPSFDGIILPYMEVVVAAPVQSTIDSIAFKEGDTVKAGQTLARLYAKVEELDMLRAKAALEKHEYDFKSSKNLYAEKIISEDEALKNKIELELAKLQYDQAAELFRQRTIVAPIDGLIVEKMREAGESVTATQPMFRLVDVSRVYVVFYIKAEDLPLLSVGAKVSGSCVVGGQTRTFSGSVDFIDPRVDAASGLIRVKILVDNHDGALRAGLRATIVLGAPEAKPSA